MKALVLSGGGSKGAYQVGALQKWIQEDGIDYEIFCGISVGAINAAYLAQFKAGDPRGAWGKLKGVWDRVTTSNVKKNWFPFGVLEAAWKTSVYNSRPLQDWVRGELDTCAISQSGKGLRVVSVSWDTYETHVATEADPSIVDRVLASSSFPVFLCPIEIGGQLWTDGGVRSITPLGQAIQAGADEVDIIMCSNPDLPHSLDHKTAAIPGLLERAIDIMSTQIEVADLKICGLKNDLAELRPEYKKVKIRLLQPKSYLIDNSLNFDPEAIKKMLAQGYEDAKALGS
jgi:NTE family protein